MMVDLCKMEIDKVGIIKKIDVSEDIKRRFLDIGIIPDSKIVRILEDYNNSISAYLIMDGIIAIRNSDTLGIGVKYEEV